MIRQCLVTTPSNMPIEWIVDNVYETQWSVLSNFVRNQRDEDSIEFIHLTTWKGKHLISELP